jgi:chlorophyllide a reductase subunit X
VIIVVGHDRQSLYAANNIASAAKYFQSMGGSTQLLGLIVNRDDGTDTADRFADAIGLPVLARVPLNQEVRMLADACKLALEVEQFNAIFADLAGRLDRREIPHCKTFTPLEYGDFLEVFGAFEPPGNPNSASTEDLFTGGKAQRGANFIADIPLTPVRQVHVTDPIQRRVQELMEEIGVHVTDLGRDEDGITVISGSTEILIGEPSQLMEKTAFLSALLKTRQAFSLIDVRYVDAPSYR